MRLGIDIGRVIIVGDGPDSSFLGADDEAAMRAPAMAGAFGAIARLTEELRGQVWLVSKCGPKIQARTRRWLQERSFFQDTGIAENHLYFCLRRGEKAPIAQKLGLHAFVDDRLDVLIAMASVVPHRVLFGAAESPVKEIAACPTWSEAEWWLKKLQRSR